jgi:hypothetical protein
MRDKLAEMDIERLGGPSLRVASIVSTEAGEWKKVIVDACIEAE